MTPFPFQHSHMKLLAFHLNSLTQHQHQPVSFTHKGIHITRVESSGIIVTRDLKPDKFLRFTIDDGTGCVNCILWLNHLTSSYFSRRCPSDVGSIAQMGRVLSGRVELGRVVRVWGRVGGFRGLLQVTVDDVVVEEDPNSEILFWLDCVRLGRRVYDPVLNG